MFALFSGTVNLLVHKGRGERAPLPSPKLLSCADLLCPARVNFTDPDGKQDLGIRPGINPLLSLEEYYLQSFTVEKKALLESFASCSTCLAA